MTQHDLLSDWINTKARNAKGLLVPVSGGSDSAYCFWICQKALPGKVEAVFAGDKDSLRCRTWLESIGPVRYIPSPSEGHKDTLRWAHFLSIGYSESLWLVGSRNRSEDILGIYSLGSRLAGFLPLAGIWKSDLMKLAQDVGVPAEVLDSSRQADPDCGRPAEMAAIPLELMDIYLKVKIGELTNTELTSNCTIEQIAYLDKLLLANEFKTQFPVRGPIIS